MTRCDEVPWCMRVCVYVCSPPWLARSPSHQVPSKLVPHLIRRVHGTADSIDAIVSDFHKEHGEAAGVSRQTIKRTVVDSGFAVRETRAPYPSQRRFVRPAILKKFELENLPMPAPPPTAAKSKPKGKKSNDATVAPKATLLNAFKPLA